MEQLTFGEQLKIVLGRKRMTIKELAEIIEEKTGKKMSRQNLTQRIGRDNFQEQDMRMIAGILGVPFTLTILSVDSEENHHGELETLSDPTPLKNGKSPKRSKEKGLNKTEDSEPIPGPIAQSVSDLISESQGIAEPEQTNLTNPDEVDITIGDLFDMHKELNEIEKSNQEEKEAYREIELINLPKSDVPKEKTKEEQEAEFRAHGVFIRHEGAAETPIHHMEPALPSGSIELNKKDYSPEVNQSMVNQGMDVAHTSISTLELDDDKQVGDINPYTGLEYESNTVRSHPNRIGYVQVYDQTIHKWMDMTEWAFMGYQERKKALLGSRYDPPTYLD